MRYLFTIFATVFLAEMADKTQLAVLLFATRPGASRLAIAAAASLALIATTVIAVFLGDRLSHLMNPRLLQGIAGSGFIVIGLWMLVTMVRQP